MQEVHFDFDREVVFRHLRGRSFEPYFGLRNGHAQTILGNLRPRYFAIAAIPAHRREFATEPEVRVVAFCHWQSNPRQHPTVIIIHGLEGSAESSYVLGTASKAFAQGFNVIRYNVRNCGGTEHLSPYLYHSGLTTDLHYLIKELIESDRLSELFLIGFSMGGNQVLKLAGEWGEKSPPEVKGICAVSPPIDLNACSRVIRQPENRIYEYSFLRSLKRKLRRKCELFPERYNVDGFDRVRSMLDFDKIVAPYYGYRNAQDYYDRASPLPFIQAIKLPTLIIHAEDDPLIPFDSFTDRSIEENSSIVFFATRHGGHVAFCGRRQPDEDRAWAENRSVEFCRIILGDLPPVAL